MSADAVDAGPDMMERFVVVRSDLTTGHIDVLGAGRTFTNTDDAHQFLDHQVKLPGCELVICELAQVWS